MRAAVDDFTVEEFRDDLERLSKKYRHLSKDLKTALKVLTKEPRNPSCSVRISGLRKDTELPIYKLKKFKSTDFHGKGSRSGFRLIYAYNEQENVIILVEVYHKKMKDNEDRDRILRYF